MCQNYKRIGNRFSVNDILTCKKVLNNCSMIKMYEKKVKLDTRYLNMLALKGTKCCKCGAEGKYFVLEKLKKNYKFHLYTVKNGKEVLITIDHIIPKSKGGGNNLSNLQPMCEDCNIEKGDSYDEEEII